MNFNERVYELTKKIPRGKVSTYKAIACKLKCKAYRAVGNALNRNVDRNVPCHRVIKSNGEIGGFRRGAKKKAEMLKKEGIEVKNNKVNLGKFLFRF